MDLVKLITDQFSDDTLGRLSSQLGTDRETAESATSAAVPSLLAALAGMATRDEGVKKLTGLFSGFDASSFSSLASLLGGDASGLMQKGSGWLSSLFGEGLTTALASAVSRFAGLDIAKTKSLLAMIMPLVLGKVASQWKSQGGTASALTSMFADQKRHIQDALPSGFSLPEIPGLPNVGDAMHAASNTTRRAAEKAGKAAPSAANWILPVAVLLLGAFFLWNMFGSRPAPIQTAGKTDSERTTAMKPVVPEVPATPNIAIPDATQLTGDLTGVFKSLNESFSGIKDAATADAALPKLEDLSRKIDALRMQFGKLPEAARTTMKRTIDDQMVTFKQKATDTLAIPGIGEKIKAIINQILTKLNELGMMQETK